MNLNQVTVPSVDVGRSAEFYQSLGLELIVKSLPHYVRLLCPDGQSTFSVHQVEALPQGDGVCVYFEVEDVSATVRQLAEKGFVFDLPPTEQPWLWTEARLKDPDGNQIIIYHAGENRINPPWRITDNNA